MFVKCFEKAVKCFQIPDKMHYRTVGSDSDKEYQLAIYVFLDLSQSIWYIWKFSAEDGLGKYREAQYSTPFP